MQLFLALFVVAALLLTVACQSPASTDAPPPTDISEQATTSPTATSRRPTPTPAPTNTLEGTPITLTFWTVEEISSLAEGEAGEFFDKTLSAFDHNNPDVRVNVLLKKPGGKGGVLDFLRTAKDTAPSILPDVVIMNAVDLEHAYADKLIQTLGGKLDRAIVQDLLPAARRVGTVDDQLVGGPLGLEMEHTVYNTGIFSGTPMVWTDVLSNNSRYLFPAKGVNGLVNDVTLSQYFSAGGELVDDEGQRGINEQVLFSVLEFYERARESGRIDETLLEASTTEELWPTYRAGNAGLAQISVSQYLTDRDSLHSTAVSALPVREESNTPVGIMHAWVLVMITDNVERQDAALRLMETFLSTENNAAWNDINKSIPVRGTSYQQLAGEDPYWQDFLFEQLKNARPEPRFSGYDRIGRILQQSVEQVIRGEATAAEASSTAIDVLQ